jgi:outer membrane immunogenic protein
MKRAVFAGVLISALAAQGAVAADVGQRPVYKAAPAALPPLPAAYNWTGFYLGINAGGAFGTSRWSAGGISTGDFDVSGATVGGTMGYNVQTGPAVWGVEADANYADVDGTTTVRCGVGCTTSNEFLATVRGRFGYSLYDRVLPYVTGGLAVGDIRAESVGVNESTTKAGFTVGGGVEFALAGGWTAKAEYLYVDLGNFNCGAACGVAGTEVKFNENIVRGGINYRFDWGGSGMSRY